MFKNYEVDILQIARGKRPVEAEVKLNVELCSSIILTTTACVREQQHLIVDNTVAEDLGNAFCVPTQLFRAPMTSLFSVKWTRESDHNTNTL